ncbi:hypothetical protein B0H10DRAFT_2348949 [Mycena sp. CBHHK59/15]|nr:hypothetical protein B0H10DRAFT_2348949 [Mycena sp. CBHHK59/15]
MHDVNVQRKRKRTRSVPQANGGSDSDESPTVRSQKRPRKKRANADKNLEKRIAINNPFPAASETGDPSAADDEFQAVTEDSWDDAVRGYIMAVANELVRTESTPEKIAEVREKNRDLVQSLEGTFMFLNPKDTGDLATVGHHSIFQKLLNAAFFAKKGKNCRAHYFNGLESLPEQTFGLLMDATVCGIDRWKTGEHQMVAFEAEEYRPIHRESMQFIKDWMAEFSRDVYPVNLARERLREMLTNARFHCISVAALALTRRFRRDYSGFQASPAVLALFPALVPAPTHCQLAAVLSPRHAAAFTSICAYVPPATACATSFGRRSPFFGALYPTGLCALSGPNTDPSELRLLIPFRKPVDFAIPTPPHPPTYSPVATSATMRFVNVLSLSPAPPSTPARPSRPPLLPYFDAARRLCAPALRRPTHSRRLHLPAVESSPSSAPYASDEHPPQPTRIASRSFAIVYYDPKTLLTSRGPRRFLDVATIRIGIVTVDDTLRVK